MMNAIEFSNQIISQHEPGYYANYVLAFVGRENDPFCPDVVDMFLARAQLYVCSQKSSARDFLAAFNLLAECRGKLRN